MVCTLLSVVVSLIKIAHCCSKTIHMEAQKPQSIEQIIEILQHGHGSGVGNVLDHLLTILPTGKFIQV